MDVFFDGKVRKMGEQRIINVPRSLFPLFPLGAAVKVVFIEVPA